VRSERNHNQLDDRPSGAGQNHLFATLRRVHELGVDGVAGLEFYLHISSLVVQE
jgi:hypothetical protein